MRPTPLESFGALYTLAARDGREAALFGNSIELALPAFEKTLLTDSFPSSYLEFPLIGAPGFDILTVYGPRETGGTFAPGAGFGYQTMFDWFAQACTAPELSCGIEVDTSSGEAQRAGVYLQHRGRTEMVAPFLESLGEAGRAASYLRVLERLPEGWPPAYVGLFPGRPKTPLRIGGYLSESAVEHYLQSPESLGAAFDTIGFSAYDETMLFQCLQLARIKPELDFQFDIMPDGSLGDSFGLSLSFNQTMPHEARACLEEGYGARLMRLFEAWGVADDRWKLVADCAFARHVPFVREDGSEGRFALCILFNYAKLKFRRGTAELAKFYLRLAAKELSGEPHADSSSPEVVPF